MKTKNATKPSVKNAQVFRRSNHVSDARLIERGMVSFVRWGDEVIGQTAHSGHVVYTRIKGQ